MGHEANNRGGGKTVHVVFKYLSNSLLQKGVGRSNASPLLTTTQLICGFFIEDDVTVILLVERMVVFDGDCCGADGMITEGQRILTRETQWSSAVLPSSKLGGFYVKTKENISYIYIYTCEHPRSLP